MNRINYLTIIPIALLLISLVFSKRINKKNDKIVRIVAAIFILLILLLNNIL
jgi:predicted membrane protein